jgi:hypothetical protein
MISVHKKEENETEQEKSVIQLPLYFRRPSLFKLSEAFLLMIIPGITCISGKTENPCVQVSLLEYRVK